jgi:O-methyltransferase involved in polyketide biosynthesis
MRKNQTSMTAIGIAIVRGIESEKPEGVRICYDPYARKFVSSFLYNFVRFFDKLGYGEVRGPGVMGFLAVRERHIDEFLQSNLQLPCPASGGVFRQAGQLKQE